MAHPSNLDALHTRWLARRGRGAGLALLLALGCAAPDERSDYFDLVGAFDRAVAVESSEGAPRADAGSGLLFLPAGSQLTYAFEGRPESVLAIARLAMRGEGSRLRVTLDSDREAALLEHAFQGPGRQLAIELPFEAATGEATAVGLTLAAESADAAPGDGVLLERPTVRGIPRVAPAAAPIAFDSTERPDVVVYLIDTLRRDRLGIYGYERPVSPHIDNFARSATLFENAFGQSSWTKPTVASVFSGVWPPTHGALGGSHRLPERFETLAERLGAAGYETAAFVTNPNISPAFGFDQGFDHFWLEKKQRSDLVNDEVVAWLDGRDESRPLFLYVHTMDPHAGYKPEEPYRSRFAPHADEMKKWKPRWRWPVANLPFFENLYDGEIAQNDAAFGELMQALWDRKLYEPSLIVVLSDHGEEFQERGQWRHGRTLYRETLNVPLMVKFPGQREGTRSDLPVSHVDVLPTILDVAGLDRSGSFDGLSLVAAVERPVFSHLLAFRAPLQYSVIADGWKLIQTHGENPSTRLYDLGEDPAEMENLVRDLPLRRALLEGLLRERLARAGGEEAEEIELSDELRNELRDLGYLQ